MPEWVPYFSLGVVIGAGLLLTGVTIIKRRVDRL